MASVFKSTGVPNVGTSLTTVYTVPAATTTTVIGMSLANVSNNSVSADVVMVKGGTSTYLIKNAPVPYGGALVVIGGDQKVVLETGNYIQVKSTAATSLDVATSILELS